MQNCTTVRQMRYRTLPSLHGRLPRKWRTHVSIGIDLGTCNSAVAVIEAGKPRMLPLMSGHCQIPSWVLSTKSGLITAAEITKEPEFDAACLISNVKRLIGQTYDSIKSKTSSFPFAIKAGLNNTITIETPFHSLTPENVSAVLLKYLVQFVESQLDQPVDHAVITIPAHFSTAQKAATLNAAELAGIHNVSLLQEPVAAALAYGLGRPTDDDLILVLDVGGGTYDVSILSSFEGIMEVVSFAGDQSLGGLDFDEAISNWIANKAQISYLDSTMKFRLNSLSERVKKEVVEKNHSCFEFHGMKLSMDIADFNSLTKHISDRFQDSILEAGKEALIDWYPLEQEKRNADPFQPPPKLITKVAFAGGSSRLPFLHSLVYQLTDLQEQKSKIDPKLCVAYGAAVYAGMLEGSISGLEIMDGAYSHELHNRVSGFL